MSYFYSQNKKKHNQYLKERAKTREHVTDEDIRYEQAETDIALPQNLREHSIDQQNVDIDSRETGITESMWQHAQDKYDEFGRPSMQMNQVLGGLTVGESFRERNLPIPESLEGLIPDPKHDLRGEYLDAAIQGNLGSGLEFQGQPAGSLATPEPSTTAPAVPALGEEVNAGDMYSYYLNDLPAKAHKKGRSIAQRSDNDPTKQFLDYWFKSMFPSRK